jgi:thymidylate synthase (FAD)
MIILDQAAAFHMGPSEAEAIHAISFAAATCFGSAPADEKSHITRIYNKGHLSVFEHVNISLYLLTDIATYKGLTRHRHCAFTIESTHYKAYGDGLNIIRVPEMDDEEMTVVFTNIECLHKRVLRKYGKMAARNVLPQAQAAGVTMTTNLREWFHIFDLRKGKENTTNMWKLMALIMEVFREQYPFFMALYESKAV